MFNKDLFTDDLRHFLYHNGISFVKAEDLSTVSRNWFALTLRGKIVNPNINHVLKVCQMINQPINNYIK